jgi:hypothetical protein
MFNGLFYWLGAKACYGIGVVSELITAESICTRQQTWNMGAVLFGASLLAVAYFVMRRR